jgi:hypothetical protein
LTSDYQEVSDKIISKQIDKFYLDNPASNFSTITKTSFPVWSKGDLHLDYSNDNLKYFIGKTPLPIKATSSLPVTIKDRVILFQSDAIVVLQGQKIIKQLKIHNPISEDYDNYSYNKWVNICNGGTDNWVYSYSYDKNIFYKRYDTKNVTNRK